MEEKEPQGTEKKTFVRDMTDRLYERAKRDPILIPRWMRVWGAIAMAIWIHCGITMNVIGIIMYDHKIFWEDRVLIAAGLAMSGLLLLSAWKVGRKGGWRKW